MKTILTTAAAMVLAGCVTVSATDQPQVAGAGSCSNEGLAQFTGRQASQQLGAEMLRVSGARTLQWINPGEMVTMDFRADRLRVHLTQQGQVERAICG